MEKKHTFWGRLTSETPTFFKKAQVLGLGMAGLGASLATISGIPPKLTAILISAGTAIAAVSQFAVRQYEPLNTPANEVKR